MNFPGGIKVGSRCFAVAVDDSNVVRSIFGLCSLLKETVFLILAFWLDCVYIRDVMMSEGSCPSPIRISVPYRSKNVLLT